MKTAVNEQEASSAIESPVAEIPALLVAGGSCSRLCRSERTTETIADRRIRSAINSTTTTRAAARE